ncbi:AzlC family protein [Companilactobacillus paralimentarius DSM 13238 = JCM 10415]|jgi:Predicted branched-chain amino acid permease (azaleucine resistance)|uniref:AzlC family protein n=1 Tax=Companilactobacillus paralimentarius DSM 13238 = JCM 10415 TaxID=1122151 RepID=A0A0R1PND8_9LACO|nr:AzlC family ABC transporter permease [Companilactobacillus paralimentarius]KAE9565166.1 azaleucine resistance protein AzlC [Companilactobacillus paralimentarius]KRL31429.1 AzlC family protein [Companilactobacillus paralimentarius DSM 13238 = JCM 10415]MDR4933614.1 AzlC family ABC transporter permease [Companilactobacillus paralimentarius]QFR70076.1 branched-chain amino acid ABC transporter permease [Companilactobacillus paralimentarius]
MDDSLSIESAIKDTLPTVFGYIGIGISFGIVAASAGMSVLMATLMSLIVYAGSAQFILVSLLAIGTPIISIVLSVFLVNSRMVLMSMTTANFFKKNSIFENIVIGSLITDESFALSMNKLNYTDGKLSFKWFNTVNLLAYLVWAASTMVGAMLGKVISDPEKLGLDFALVAMFIGLLYLQLISDKSISLRVQLIVVVIMLPLVYFGLIFISSDLLILVVTLIGCALGVILKHAIN